MEPFFVIYYITLNQPKLDMKMKIKNLILLLLVVFFNNGIFAQDGANDPTFNPIDTGYSNGVNGGIGCVLALPDGKMVVAGAFDRYTNVNRNNIARINADETLDETFNPGEGANNYIEVLLRQPDGKIIIGGRFTEFDGEPRSRIARLNEDGSLDETFNPGMGADNIVYALAIQADDKILVGGNFKNFNGTTIAHLVRLNTNGTIDTSFVVSGVDSSVMDIAVQSDDKIIAVGNFSQINGVQKNKLVRLNSDGGIDTTFLSGIGPNYSLSTVSVNSTGKIFIGGMFDQFNGQNIAGLISLNENGSVNTAFNVGGGINGWVTSIALQPDGKVLAGGSFNSYNGNFSSKSVVRINTDGTQDMGFLPAEADGLVFSVVVKADGKIIVVGGFLVYNNMSENSITSLNSNGSRDITFDIGNGTGADNVINAAQILSDDKIVIGGNFYYYNGVARNKIAKLDVDGGLDESFNPGTGFNGNVSVLGALPNGKILVGGEFTTFNGQTVKKLIRLNADGSLDTSFNLVLPYMEEHLKIYKIALQSDGKIIIGGYLFKQTAEFYDSYSICRINADGSYDVTFNSENILRPGDDIDIIVQPDDKVLLAFASAISSNGPQQSVMRLSSNGDIDTSFTAVLASHMRFCNDIALQQDGKIIISGITSFGETGTLIKVERINADGTLDETFEEINLSRGGGVIKLQSDGKLIIANMFGENDIALNSLARFNHDGSLDETFSGGLGGRDVTSVLFQSTGKMIIAGSFREYDEAGRNRIARVNNTETMNVEIFNSKNNNVVAYKNDNSLKIDSFDKDIKSIEVYDLTGRLITQKNSIGSNSISVKDIFSTNTILALRITLVDGTRVTKKIYY
ncbi:WD domain, G-beta repeat [compost metagenome]